MNGSDDKTSKPPRPSSPPKVPEIGKGAKEGVAEVVAQAAEILLPPEESPKPAAPSKPPVKVESSAKADAPAKAEPAAKAAPAPADFMQSPEEPARKRVAPPFADFLQSPEGPKRPAVPEPAPFLESPEAPGPRQLALPLLASAPADAALPPAPSQTAGGGTALLEAPLVGACDTATAVPGPSAAELDAGPAPSSVLAEELAAPSSADEKAPESAVPVQGEATPQVPAAALAEQPPLEPEPAPAREAEEPVQEPMPEVAPPVEVPSAPQVASRAEGIAPSSSAGGGRGVVSRPYSLPEVSRLLAACATVMFLLDADGLLTWVKRMDVGRAQSAWLTAVVPYQKAFDAAGLTRPRRAIADAAEALASALGGREDALFAEAWSLVEMAPYLDAMAAQEPQDLGPLGPAASPEPGKAGTAVNSTVLLVGDSLFAGNLAAAIGKTFGKGTGVKVVSAYQTATGLSRPDVFDWGYVVGPLVERERPRWVVCSFGANDAQAIRVDGKLLPFGEAAWEAVYRQRVRTMMKQVASGGAKVLWLGLPPMREESFDRRARRLNAIFKREARSVPGVDFLELSMLFSGPDGGYATFVNDGKRLVRVRMEDGVHYAPAGAQSIARWVWDWTREHR